MTDQPHGTNGPAINVEVNLSKTDVVRASLQHTLRSKWWWIFFVAFGTYVSWIGSWNADQSGVIAWISMAIVGLLSSCLWGMIALPILALVQYARLGKGVGIVGLHKFSFGDVTFEEWTPANQSFYNWASIQGVSETSAYIYLHINGTQYFLIPKRDVGSVEAVRTLAHALREKHAAAQRRDPGLVN